MLGKQIAETATVLGASWGLSAGLSHLIRLNAFTATVRSFGVLPARFAGPYARLAAGALVLGGVLILAPVGWVAGAGAALLAVTFVSFAIGSAAAARAQDRSRRVACGCLGGYLSSDLTGFTWVLPAGLAGILFTGFPGPLGAAGFTYPDSLAAVANAAAVSVLLVLIVEGGATWYRRQLWLRYRVRAQ